MGLGKSMSGGGMRCFETKKSKESSSSRKDCYSFSGDYFIVEGCNYIKLA
jgi:hypothetical protein